jgi:hypothetical protein
MSLCNYVHVSPRGAKSFIFYTFIVPILGKSRFLLVDLKQNTYILCKLHVQITNVCNL